jgi:hypothetical protein
MAQSSSKTSNLQLNSRRKPASQSTFDIQGKQAPSVKHIQKAQISSSKHHDTEEQQLIMEYVNRMHVSGNSQNYNSVPT